MSEEKQFQTLQERKISLLQLQSEVGQFFVHLVDLGKNMPCSKTFNFESTKNTFSGHIAELCKKYTDIKSQDHIRQTLLRDIVPLMTKAGEICQQSIRELEEVEGQKKILGAMEPHCFMIISLLQQVKLPVAETIEDFRKIKKSEPLLPQSGSSKFKKVWENFFDKITRPTNTAEPLVKIVDTRVATPKIRQIIDLGRSSKSGGRAQELFLAREFPDETVIEREPDIIVEPLIPKRLNARQRITQDQIDWVAANASVNACLIHVFNIIQKTKDVAEDETGLSRPITMARDYLKSQVGIAIKMLDQITPNMLAERRVVEEFKDKARDSESWNLYREHMDQYACAIQQDITARDVQLKKLRPEMLRKIANGPLRAINRIFARAIEQDSGEKLFSKTDSNKVAFMESYRALLAKLGIELDPKFHR